MTEVKENPSAYVEGEEGGDFIVSCFADDTEIVPARVNLPIEKPIHEARSTEPDAAMILPTQFTLIFGGIFLVFDGIPAEKVQEILCIAASAKATETKNATNINLVLKRSLSFSSTSTVASPKACISAADLPIARRRSLQRFLEKRRDRFTESNASTVLPIRLTIIFGGSFHVYDEIPTEKIQEILRIAAAAKETKNATSINPALNRALSFSSTSTVASAADLPIARRRSLQSFLQKRQHRSVNKIPYAAPVAKTESSPFVTCNP